MSFSEIELKRIDKIVGGLCRQKTPQGQEHLLKFEYRIKGHEVLILEIRPRWNNPQELTEMSVAKFRFNRTRNIWQLYWQRASGKWLAYDESTNCTTLDGLVKAVSEDPYGCFFG
jgi:hypothetical protein